MDKKVDERLKELPLAIEPKYGSPATNQSILLFDGKMVLNFPSGQQLSTHGIMKWNWLPFPSIRIGFVDPNLPRREDFTSDNKTVLEIAALNLSSHVTLTRMQPGANGTEYSGQIDEPILLGEDNQCDSLIFHIPNFHIYSGKRIRDINRSAWLGRLCLESTEWSITLDQNKDAREIKKGLTDQGGYAITHTGELKRIDGDSFKLSEASDILEALRYFFSFLRGNWCAPILVLGRKGEGYISRKWATPHLTPWKLVGSWFPCIAVVRNNDNLNQAFRGFMDKWNNDLWKEPIKHCIHWYIVSNIGAGGLEGAIVLTQNAFELLSWLYFIEDIATASFNSIRSFNTVKASTKIRNLLNALNIPVEILPDLIQLQNAATLLNTADGPETIVRLRNAFVHPKKSKREEMQLTSTQAKMEAKELGLWYLELILLKLFKYEGDYNNRFRSGWPKERLCTVPYLNNN